MPWGAVAAGIAALASIYASNRANKKNREQQKKANDANIANQNAMWEKTNEYNDPTNQMMRLQKAGLNPHLIYGSGAPYNTAQNQNMPDVQTKDYINPLENLPQHVNDYIQVRQQERRISNETMVATSNVAKNAQDIANQKTKNARDKFDLAQAQRMSENSYNLSGLQVRQAEAELKGQMIQNSQLPEKHKKELQEANTRIQLMGNQMSESQLRREQIKLEIELKKSGLENAPWWARMLFRGTNEYFNGYPGLDIRNGGQYKN